jgi:hypothetical protein
MSYETLFDNEPRVFAFSATTMHQVLADPDLHAPLPEVPRRSDSRIVDCICGGRDQTDGLLVLRALLYPGTASVTPLTDGKLAYRGYWSLAVIAAAEDGSIDADELTDQEFADLRPQPETLP